CAEGLTDSPGPLSTAHAIALSIEDAQMPDKTPAPPAPAASPAPAQPKGNLYTVSQAQLDRAAKAMNLSSDVYTIVSSPKNELIVNFPVRLDSGKYVMFKGYRVQHNNILGPYKGGIRYHEDVSLDELKGLSAA